MIRWGWLFCCLAVSGAEAAYAQTASVTVAKTSSGLKTTYSVANESTTVTTTASGTNRFDGKMQSYLFPTFQQGLKSMAFVTSVMQTAGEESVEAGSEWMGYDTKKRKSNMFVNLSLPSPITLLFQVEETYRKCKGNKPTVVLDEEGGSFNTCLFQSTLTVRGPISVYGNVATSINVDALLRNKQEFSLSLEKPSNGTDAIMTSVFSVKSTTFDESLARFFGVFNIPVFIGKKNEVGIGGELLDKVSPLTSRQRLMLGISRIARQANERMLNP